MGDYVGVSLWGTWVGVEALLCLAAIHWAACFLERAKRTQGADHNGRCYRLKPGDRASPSQLVNLRFHH